MRGVVRKRGRRRKEVRFGAVQVGKERTRFVAEVGVGGGQ